MFTHHRTQGFILGKTDRGEYDRVFTIYTKDFGKLELLAKAERKIKSKLRGGLELFYLSDIEFIQGKAYKTLTDAILIDDFKALRKDLERLVIAYKVSEVFDKLVRGQEPDEKIWKLLSEVFGKLNNSPFGILYYYFLWNFLSLLGYQPALYFCSGCRKKLTLGNIYFNFKAGGLICSHCQKGEEDKSSSSPITDRVSLVRRGDINPNAIKIIRLVLKKDWQVLKKLKFSEEDLKSLKIFSKQYFLEILEQTE